MKSFDYDYQNALRQAIVFSIFCFFCEESLVCDTNLHYKDYREMHSGSCSQCRCPIIQTLQMLITCSINFISLTKQNNENSVTRKCSKLVMQSSFRALGQKHMKCQYTCGKTIKLCRDF